LGFVIEQEPQSVRLGILCEAESGAVFEVRQGVCVRSRRAIVAATPRCEWRQTRVTPDQLTDDRQKFISPILFVDSHSASHDFTHALKDDPDFPMEPTKDWMWYKPKE
jgi:hypothetical protein